MLNPRGESLPKAPLPDTPGGWASSTDSREGMSVFQRIGWRRPSADERRWWLVQGAIVLASVLVIGSLMFLAFR